MRSDRQLPKYFLIAREIERNIKSGLLLPGMQVPSENQIIEEYRVSNTTARKALQEIERAGWGVRIKGKGTFVRNRNVVRSVNRILSFTNNMIEAGYRPSTRVLLTEVIPGGYTASINGRRYVMNGPVYKIHRLRFGDSVPMMVEVRYISKSLCPDIDKEPLSESLYKIYEQRYGHNLVEIHQMLSTIMLEAGIMEFFNLEESIPGFLVDGVTFCGKEIILEMERSIYRGDKYRFAVRAMS